MLPDNSLSAKARLSGFAYPVKGPGDALVDWEMAGVYLNDPSQGLLVKLWRLDAKPNVDTGLVDVVVSAPGGVAVGEASRVLFSGANIGEVSLAFDQNMNPCVAYMQGSDSKIYWHDPTIPGMTHTTLPAGCYDLRCTLDDKRRINVANSDIVLAYIRAGNLCVRYQRDRYDIEHILRSGIGSNANLVSMAMNRGLRLQFRLRSYELDDDPGALVQAEPFLADVVADLLKRSGVPATALDAGDLYERVDGYKVATPGGADAMIQPLRQAFFFDSAEYDRKLRFVKRGRRAPVATITDADLVERDGSPMELDRAQEAELLRKVNVISIDPAAGYTATKQTAERRSGTVKATGESSIEVPLTMAADQAATVALRRMKVAWGELHKAGFHLGIAWTALTPTDVIEYTDKRGRKMRIRVVQVEEDSGVLEFEACDDAPWAYDSEAAGVIVPPPISTTPGLVGDTIVAVLNIPILRDQDDELGWYVGARGTEAGWRGGQLQLSTDGGATISAALDIAAPSVIGTTLTPLVAEIGGEYLSRQTLQVNLPEQPESISMDTLLRYANRAAVQRVDGSWEVLQYQTVTPLGGTLYALSGLVRGRYATPPAAVPAGAAVVLIDDSLTFVQLQQWMVGTTLSVRGVSAGQDEDDVSWSPLSLDNPASQQEWPVHHVRAERDGANAVTVSWIGRARLGVETAPRQSKYFSGYRVSYSDGFTADTTESSHTRASVPAGATVQVAAINSITGPGPASEAIPT